MQMESQDPRLRARPADMREVKLFRAIDESPPGGAEAGFARVEFVVVLVVLVVLSGIAVARAGGALTAGSTSCQADVRAVETAVEAWRIHHNSYPSLGPSGQAELTSAAGNGPFLQSWPRNRRYRVSLDTAVPGQVEVTPSCASLAS